MSFKTTFHWLKIRLNSKAGRVLLSKLVFPIGLFMGIMFLGVFGYMIIEGYSFLDSFYFTSITISTTGFSEIRPLSAPGKIFTIFLILINLGVFTYVVALFSQYLIDGRYIKTYKLLKMENRISQLQNHVIVCGYGRNGRQAAKVLTDNNVQFVLVERDDFQNREKPEVKYMITGDATHDQTLIEAGIYNARAIVTSLPQDTDNLFVVLTQNN